jgi:hypothetical protein
MSSYGSGSSKYGSGSSSWSNGGYDSCVQRKFSYVPVLTLANLLGDRMCGSVWCTIFHEHASLVDLLLWK